MKQAGPFARLGDRRGAYRVFWGKPEGKRPLGRHRLRLKDNIKGIFTKYDGAWTGLI